MSDYQPNSHYCFVCGLKNKAGLQVRFQNDGENQVKVETQICNQHQGYPGIAHGGVVAALLDETMGRAGFSNSTQRFWYTAKMEIRYRKHVPLNTPLIVRGRIVKDRGRTATAAGEVILPDGSIAAEATSTLFELPPEEIQEMIDNQALGWQVYSDEEYHERTERNC